MDKRKLDDMTPDEIRQRFKYAFSYLIPIWRIILYSDEANSAHYTKIIKKRLGI